MPTTEERLAALEQRLDRLESLIQTGISQVGSNPIVQKMLKSFGVKLP